MDFRQIRVVLHKGTHLADYCLINQHYYYYHYYLILQYHLTIVCWWYKSLLIKYWNLSNQLIPILLPYRTLHSKLTILMNMLDNLYIYIFNFRENNWDESDVADCLKQLQEQGLVKAMELDSYTRVQHQDTEIQVRVVFYV